MRVRLRSADGTPLGYLTDDPAFDYRVEASAPDRERLVERIEASADWTMTLGAGEVACGGTSEVPASDAYRVERLAERLPREFDLRVERVDGG